MPLPWGPFPAVTQSWKKLSASHPFPASPVCHCLVVTGTQRILRFVFRPCCSSWNTQPYDNWPTGTGVGTRYHAPGPPWENAYLESSHRHWREERRTTEGFGNLREAQGRVEDYRRGSHPPRPPSSRNDAPLAGRLRRLFGCGSGFGGACATPNGEEVADSLTGTGT
jgi:hypothetical protein